MRTIPTLLILLLTAVPGPAAEADPPPQVPTLYLIGDSTVKNGRGDGAGGLWGWGQVIAAHFDTHRIRIANRALGGRSSRTYLTEGLWDRVVADLRPGDFVLMQFGHNDGGQLFTGDRPRASLKGIGEETREGTVEQTGRAEVVHTYGWYLRRYIADARAAGATPMVLSPVPRNLWSEGRVARASGDYGRWARASALEGNAPFIDLNELVALTYEVTGETTVRRDYFTGQDHTHTTRPGARVNAACVAAGIRGSVNCSLRDYLLEPPAVGGSIQSSTSRRFLFGSEGPLPGTIAVAPATRFSSDRGYGFDLGTQPEVIDPGTADPLIRDGVTGPRPFFFSVAVPEGNVRVAVTLGDGSAPSMTTVKAESRRLMLENVVTLKGEAVTRTFTVNVRMPEIATGGRVRLKDRERGTLHWDGKLTLEFSGARPSVSAVEIAPAPDAITVYLAGDSTVTDQPFEPWNSWGQMLPRFFSAEVAVANHAESGETIRSSLGALRFDKVFSTLKPGDYVFLQFGHNDMKDRSADALSVYRANLSRLVARVRQHGATPVLITSMERKAGVNQDTLGAYPQTVREVAQGEGVALIDLHRMSKTLYRSLGDDLDRAFVDGTHHNNYGSYELARCVVEGIRATGLPLAQELLADLPGFDPARPDPVATFALPASPQQDPAKPDGN